MHSGFQEETTESLEPIHLHIGRGTGEETTARFLVDRKAYFASQSVIVVIKRSVSAGFS